MSKEDKIKLLQDSILEQLTVIVDEAEGQTNSFAQQTIAKNTFRRVRQQILDTLFNQLEVVFPVIPETPTAESVSTVVENTTEVAVEENQHQRRKLRRAIS